jgi:hypothetical protein
MAEERTRSLLLIAADADERRLIAAIAARSSWSVVNASDEETAVALLQGPHGREVQAVLISGWASLSGPQLIAALRDQGNYGKIHPVWLFIGPALVIEQSVEFAFFDQGPMRPFGQSIFALLT